MDVFYGFVKCLFFKQDSDSCNGTKTLHDSILTSECYSIAVDQSRSELPSRDG